MPVLQVPGLEISPQFVFGSLNIPAFLHYLRDHQPCTRDVLASSLQVLQSFRGTLLLLQKGERYGFFAAAALLLFFLAFGVYVAAKSESTTPKVSRMMFFMS